MGEMDRRRAVTIAGAILVLGVAPLAAELHYSRLYVSGRQAVLAGEHHRGVLRLLSAIQKHSTEGDPWVRIYGRHRAPYLPYFYLGKAFFELGEYDRAEAAWEESLRQGAVLEAQEHDELQRYLELLRQEVVVALRSDARWRAEAARQLAGELEEALGALPADERLAAWQAEVRQLVVTAGELEELLATDSPLRVAPLIVATEALQSQMTVAGHLERSLAEVAGAHRLEGWRSRWQELSAHVASGECRRDVLAKLETLLSDAREGLEPSELAGNTVVVAQGWLACEEPDAARSLLFSVPRPLRHTMLWLELEREVAAAMSAAAERDAAHRRRQVARKLEDAARDVRCHSDLLEAALPLADASEPSPEEGFRTYLAGALAACGLLDEAGRQLEHARSEGERGPELERVAGALEREQRERAEALRAEALRRRYDGLAEHVRRGVCIAGAVDGLKGLLQETGAEALRPQLDIDLARAYLACGDPDAADQALHRWEGWPSSVVEEVRRLSGVIAERRAQAADASRRRLVEERLGAARELLASGACSRPALAMLVDLSPAEDTERQEAALLLAQGHLGCGDLDAARQLIGTATATIPSPSLEWQRLAEELALAEASREHRQWAMRIEEALASRMPDRCGPELAAELLELHATAPPPLADIAVDRRATLGRRLVACGELGAAEEIVAELESAATEQVEVLAQELAAEAERRRLVTLREAALAGFLEGTAAVLAARCDAQALGRLRRLAGELPMGEVAPELRGWLEERTGLPYAPELYLAEGYQICGDETETARFLSLARPWLGTADQWRAQHLERWLRHRQGERLYQQRVALLIGASEYARYQGGWFNLPGVDHDLRSLHAALEAYGFDEIRVLDKPVTRHRVEEAMTSFIRDFGGDPESRNLLFVYFAGHGATLRERYPLGQDLVDAGTFESGFLVPEDAPRPDGSEEGRERFLDKAIGMDEVDRWARQIQSPQAFFVFDSCFSGTIFRAIGRSRGLLRPGREPEPTMLPAIVRTRATLPVRLFATAGAADQLVPDESIFSRLLVEIFAGQRQDADFTGDGFLLGQELCLFLEDQVSELTNRAQTPQCGTMPPPFNEGDVVFRASGSETLVALGPSPQLDAQVAHWNEIRDSRDPVLLRGYLEEFPQGHFAGLVKFRLEAALD